MGKFDGVLLVSDFDNTILNTELPRRTGCPIPPISQRNVEALRYFKMCIRDSLTAAAEACKAQFPGMTVGILATKGTLSTQLYQNALGEAGVPYLIPEAAEQDALMRVIYDGVKAGKGPDAYRADLLTVVEHMMTRGAGVFLLGCTELPLAAEAVGLTVPVVDPTAELAKAAIRFCGFRVRAK